MTADITIVGLGPGQRADKTVRAAEALDTARVLFLRTDRNAGIEDLLAHSDVRVVEKLISKAAGGGPDWVAGAELFCEEAAKGAVVLGIPGHPQYGEELATRTVALARDRHLSVQVIDGLSSLDLISSALETNLMRNNVQIVDATLTMAACEPAEFAGGLPPISPREPVLLSRVYRRDSMNALQTLLERYYPSDSPVIVLDAIGTGDEIAPSTTVIGEVHAVVPSDLCSIYIPPIGDLEATRDPRTLQHIVARLRREDGCPWDRKQTNQSLAGSLVDEVYEVVDAINAGDDANLAEELGDLLLLIMMHAQIAEERGAFILEDVYDGIATKIVRRHPHVFGDESAHNSDDVVGLWQQIKQQEKAERPDKPEKAADGQPHSMPALERATRVLKKHPADVAESSADSRQQALFDAVAAVVSAGDDPNQILRQSLEKHVAGTVSAGKSGEKNASN